MLGTDFGNRGGPKGHGRDQVISSEEFFNYFINKRIQSWKKKWLLSH